MLTSSKEEEQNIHAQPYASGKMRG